MELVKVAKQILESAVIELSKIQYRASQNLVEEAMVGVTVNTADTMGQNQKKEWGGPPSVEVA
jgi:hypothetical protein